MGLYACMAVGDWDSGCKNATEPFCCCRTFSSGSRKRSRCAVEAGELENACSGRNIYGDHVLGDVCGQASGQPMAADCGVSPLKRTLSFGAHCSSVLCRPGLAKNGGLC